MTAAEASSDERPAETETDADTSDDAGTSDDADTSDEARPVTPDSADMARTETGGAITADESAGPETTAAFRGRGGSSGRRTLLLVAASVVGLYLIVGAAWAVDAAAHRGRPMRGVALADRDVGGADRDELTSAITTLTDRLADESVAVTVDTTTVEADPIALGARLDDEAMIDEALEARRGGFLPVRPLTWAAGLFDDYTVEPVYTVDPDDAREAVETLIDPALAQVSEPTLDIEDDTVVLVPGASGRIVDPDELVANLPAVIAGGPPFELALTASDQEPELDDDTVAALAEEINLQTSEPIAVRVLDDTVEISPNTQRSWILLETSGSEVGWTVDETLALSDLRPLFPTLGSEDQQARFEIVDGEPIIIPASETVVCCAETSGSVLAETIASPLTTATPVDSENDAEAEPELRMAELEPIITGFDEGVAELESLGIVEQVSTFTTNHACCQNRVINIQRFADLMQGVIVRPGEELSLNGFVGQRTREKGFVADGAIAQGNFEQQVGGGISQYATTFFNAAFFAGVEFLEYQSHSIYISRYPRGREATISWRKPDLKILNNTPYGILVWNEYTPTSITVSFYSTKHLEVEALPLRRSSNAQCRIDITPRRITYPDGTVSEDTVQAIYRPGEGLDCNGNSTTPEPEDETPPDPDPAPAPAPTPTTAPPPADDDGGGEGGDEILPPD